MPVSGSFDYTVDGTAIITSALEDIQVAQNGETLDNNDVTTALRELNLMVKAWMGKPGFAPGLKRWTRRTAYLFLQKNRNVYNLGPVAGGDYCCAGNYTQGTLTASAAAGVTALTVSAMYAAPTYTTATTPASTDYVGVVLDSGTVHWTTVNGSPTLPGTLTLTAAIPAGDSAASGNYIFSFATTLQTVLPLDILTCYRRDPTASPAIDFQMSKYNDIQEYEMVPNKNITSTPVEWWFQQGLTYGQLFLNCVPTNTSNILRMTLLYPIDDEDSVANTLAFPQQWYSALAKGLGKRLAPKFGKAWTDTMEGNYMEAMSEAGNVDPDQVKAYFQPGL